MHFLFLVFQLYSQLLVFVCSFFFGVLIRIFIFCFDCVLCSWSNFFILHGMVAICALCTYISICETNRVDAFFFLFYLSALVCDCIWNAIELHCSVYTVQYLHFYLECKQKDAVTKLKQNIENLMHLRAKKIERKKKIRWKLYLLDRTIYLAVEQQSLALPS